MFQQIILIGNLGADPETKSTQGGTSITNIRVATSEKWRDRQSGEQQERTTWHRVVLFGKQADVAGQYLRKGSLVTIIGRIQTRQWEDSQGQTRYMTEVVADRLKLTRLPSGQRGQGGQQHDAPPNGAIEDDIPF